MRRCMTRSKARRAVRRLTSTPARGTNNWHGQLYGTYANNLLNASPFFFNQAYQLTQQGIGVFPQFAWSTPGFVAGTPESQPAALSKPTSSSFLPPTSAACNEDQCNGTLRDDRPHRAYRRSQRHRPLRCR